MEIDWSKAPDWAKQVGETRTGRHICWIGDDLYGYVGQEPKHYDLAKGPGYPGHRCLDEFEIIADRPKVEPWNGEVLPPVGVPIEYRRRYAPNGVWHQTQINFLSGQHVIYCDSDGEEVRDNPSDIEFRPIRTPEQIAAEERKVGIQALLDTFNSNFEGHVLDGLSAIWDDGYRKQHPTK
jgi:hypothetical protein